MPSSGKIFNVAFPFSLILMWIWSLFLFFNFSSSSYLFCIFILEFKIWKYKLQFWKMYHGIFKILLRKFWSLWKHVRRGRESSKEREITCVSFIATESILLLWLGMDAKGKLTPSLGLVGLTRMGQGLRERIFIVNGGVPRLIWSYRPQIWFILF